MLQEPEFIAPSDSLLYYSDLLPREIWLAIVNSLYDMKRVRWFLTAAMTVSRSWREMAYLSVTSLDPNCCNLLALADDVNRFVALRSLTLPGNSTISDVGLSGLLNLTFLDISRAYERRLTKAALATLTNLATLILGPTRGSDYGLAKLTNLTQLVIARNKVLRDRKISRLTKLTQLAMPHNAMITNDGLRLLTRLTWLDISGGCQVTDASVASLCQLQHLDISRNRCITNATLLSLPRLTSLRCAGADCLVTDEGVKGLSYLTQLVLSGNQKVTNDGIRHMTGTLESLELDYDTLVTDETLYSMTNLTSLSLRYNTKITIDSISRLTKLTSLDIRKSVVDNAYPRNDLGISVLTNLTMLNILNYFGVNDDCIANLRNLSAFYCSGDNVSSNGLSHLTNLTTLWLRKSSSVSNDAISRMTKLTTLDLRWNLSISDAGISGLVGLTDFDLQNNKTVITNTGLSQLVNLTRLNIIRQPYVTEAGLKDLPNLIILVK